MSDAGTSSVGALTFVRRVQGSRGAESQQMRTAKQRSRTSRKRRCRPDVEHRAGVGGPTVPRGGASFRDVESEPVWQRYFATREEAREAVPDSSM